MIAHFSKNFNPFCIIPFYISYSKSPVSKLYQKKSRCGFSASALCVLYFVFVGGEQHRTEIGHGILPVDIFHIRRFGERRYVYAIRLKRRHGFFGETARLADLLCANLANTATACSEVQNAGYARICKNLA